MSGMKACCISGGALKGQPKGSIKQVGGLDCYVSGQSNGKQAIVVLTDAFGLALINNKIISDLLAEELGTVVYCPDLFNGAPIDPARLADPPRPSEDARLSFFQKVTGIFSTVRTLAIILPFILTNRPSTKIGMLNDFLAAVPEQELGLSGYCYGGGAIWTVYQGNAGDRVKSLYTAHPSLLGPDDLLKIADNAPFLIQFPEKDSQLTMQTMKEALEKVKQAKFPAHVDFFEDGYAARPNPSSETDMKAFEKALKDASAWHRKNLKL